MDYIISMIDPTQAELKSLKIIIQDNRVVEGSDVMRGIYPAQVVVSDYSKIYKPLVLRLKQQGKEVTVLHTKITGSGTVHDLRTQITNYDKRERWH